MGIINYRRASSVDYSKIIELQNKNLRNLNNHDDSSDGFLLTPFTIDQFKEMNSEIAVVVGINNETLCGYLCASKVDFNKKFPVLNALIEHLSEISFKRKPLNQYRLCISNPMCIDKDYRGTEMFFYLCKKILDFIPLDYEVAVSVVSIKNNRSL